MGSTGAALPKGVRQKAVAIAKPNAANGRRVGTKRSDTRWQDETGHIWASKFEYQVFCGLQAGSGRAYTARKCERGADTFNYESPVKSARCRDCKSSAVFTERTYTPDFCITGTGGSDAQRGRYYIEAKGYLRSEQRRLLRDFRKACPLVNLRLVVARDYAVTRKLNLTEWVEKFLRCPVVVWTGELPEDWL